MGPKSASKPSRSTRGKAVTKKTAMPIRDPTRRDALPSLRDTTTRPQKPWIPSEHNYEIRRILAERQCGDDIYYLVDWYPSWQSKGRTLKAVQKEWENLKKNNEHMFEYDGDMKLLSTNPTQDDDDERVRQMLEAVAEQFLAHIGRSKSKTYIEEPTEVSAKLFLEKDWAFAQHDEQDHEQRADAIAHANNQELPSAAEVMRRTYHEFRRKKRPYDAEDEMVYSSIEVRFMGEIDPAISGVVGCDSRRVGSPYSFIAPLFSHAIYTLQPSKWSDAACIADLTESIAHIVSYAPYILRNPLSMMFVRFFFGANALSKILKSVRVRMAEGWEERTRSEFLYEYMRVFGKWEKRTVDGVQMTYFHARMLVEDGGRGDEESSGCEDESEEGSGEGEDMDVDDE